MTSKVDQDGLDHDKAEERRLDSTDHRSALVKSDEKLNQALEEIKNLRAENERLLRDNERILRDNEPRFTFNSKVPVAGEVGLDPGRKIRTSFQVHLLLDRIPLDVDPRDTLAAHFISEKFAKTLFHFAMQNKAGTLLFSAAFVLSEIFMMLSVTVDSSLGWYCLIGFPNIMTYIILLNRQMLWALIRTFEWWGMLYFSTICIISIMDAVAFNPPKVVAFSFGAMSLFYTISTDARPFVKRQLGYSWRITWIMASCINWILLILWWCEKWVDVRQTIVPIGSVISLDVQSIGFSSYFTLCVVISKYALVIFLSKESNQCIILKSSLSYRYRLHEENTKLQVMI